MKKFYEIYIIIKKFFSSQKINVYIQFKDTTLEKKGIELVYVVYQQFGYIKITKYLNFRNESPFLLNFLLYFSEKFLNSQSG